jgi:hypothetical protein
MQEVCRFYETGTSAVLVEIADASTRREGRVCRYLGACSPSERRLAAELLPRGERMTVGPLGPVLPEVPTAVALPYLGPAEVLYEEREASCVQAIRADPEGRFAWQSGLSDLSRQPVPARQQRRGACMRAPARAIDL